MSASFVEVNAPGWAFWRAAADACIGLIVGTLYAFLGILVAGIVGEEALSALYWELDLDPIFRATMGVFLVAAAVLGFGTPLVFVAERIAALRAVERLPEGAVPPRPLRLRLSTSPYALMQTTGTVLFWCAVGIAAFFALGGIFTEDLREDPVTWIALGICLLFVVIGWAVRSVGRAGLARTLPRMQALWSAWKKGVSEADSADARRRAAAAEVDLPRWLVTPSARFVNRVARVLSVATVVALAAFMLSVYLRQQCRYCEPVRWNEPVENGIDVLSLSSGVAILACAVLGLTAWVGGLLLQGVREVALARWIRDGQARRIDVTPIEPLVAENRAAVRLEYGLCAAGAILVVLAGGMGWAETRAVDIGALSITGCALIVLGFVAGWTDAGRRRAERQAIRDVLFPGDAAQAGDETKEPKGTARRGRRRR